MNARIDWIDDGEAVGIGAPVLVQQGHTYEGRLLVDMPCSQIPTASFTNLRAALEQQFDFVRVMHGAQRPVSDWPADRIDFPHDTATQCLIWISGAYKFPDTSWEVDTLTPPGISLIDIWDQTSGQMLVDNTSFKLPRTPPVSTIPNIPFPLPQIPGASRELLLRAIDALSKAGAACPQLAVVGGPLQYAATAFATFAALSISSLGGDGSASLAALEQQLDGLCPAWRTTSASAPVPLPGPSLPPASGDISQLLAHLVVALTAGAFQQLPELATQATSIGQPLLAQEINRFAAEQTAGPPAPPPDAQPPGEPPAVPPAEEAPKKKKSNTGLVLGAVLLAGLAVAVAVSN